MTAQVRQWLRRAAFYEALANIVLHGGVPSAELRRLALLREAEHCRRNASDLLRQQAAQNPQPSPSAR